jgi:hypothetical protein
MRRVRTRYGLTLPSLPASTSSGFFSGSGWSRPGSTGVGIASPIGFEMSLGGSSSGLSAFSGASWDGLVTVFSVSAKKYQHDEQCPYLPCKYATDRPGEVRGSARKRLLTATPAIRPSSPALSGYCAHRRRVPSVTPSGTRQSRATCCRTSPSSASGATRPRRH